MVILTEASLVLQEVERKVISENNRVENVNLLAWNKTGVIRIQTRNDNGLRKNDNDLSMAIGQRRDLEFCKLWRRLRGQDGRENVEDNLRRIVRRRWWQPRRADSGCAGSQGPRLQHWGWWLRNKTDRSETYCNRKNLERFVFRNKYWCLIERYCACVSF